MRTGKVVIVVLMLLSFSSFALALTNQEKLQLLEEKFLKGEISEDIFRRLEKKYKGETTPSAAPVSSPKVVVSKENLVSNGNFETPDPSNPSRPQGWIPSNEHAKWVDEGHNGGKCVYLEKGSWLLAEGRPGWHSYLTVKPNTMYKVVCWIKADKVPQITFPRSFGKDWDLYLPTSSQWKEYKKIVNSRNTSGKIKVGFVCEGGGQLYYDDFSITELTQSQTAAPSVPTKPAAAQAGNIVPNGTFEIADPEDPTRPKSWKPSNEHAKWVDGGRNGGKCLCLEPGAWVPYVWGWIASIPLKSNTRYIVTCWVKTESTNLRADLVLPKSIGKDYDLYLPKSKEWTRFRKIINVAEAKGIWMPDKTMRHKSYVAFYLDDKANGPVYFDDLSITELR